MTGMKGINRMYFCLFTISAYCFLQSSLHKVSLADIAVPHIMQ